jgi:pre-mRNA-splicing factor SYF1
VTEEDLLLNFENQRSWISYISAIRERVNKDIPRPSENPSLEESLLGPLVSKEARDALQELTMVYERALAIFPTSFKLWKLYMTMRQSFVLGQPTTSALRARKANANRGSKSKTDVTEMLSFAEAEYEWRNGLDGIVGFDEWKSLIATGERMIQWQSNVSRPSETLFDRR